MKMNKSIWLGIGFIAVGLTGTIFKARRRISFQGKTAVITGGSRGLGLILAKQLARKGAHVVLCARDAEELVRARRMITDKGGSAEIYVCDVALKDQVDKMMREIIARNGNIDILINNASIIQIGPINTMNTNDFAAAMDVNFWGTVHCTLAALPAIPRGGRIVNITSIGAAVPVPHLHPYTSAKFAALGFSQALHAELAEKGIRVVSILPGLMRTGSFLHALVKGNRKAEISWFSLGATLPLASMSATRAARRILKATRDGDAYCTIGVQAKVMRVLFALMPNIGNDVLGLVNRLVLPKAHGGEELARERAEPGYEHRSLLSRPPITILGDLAARRFNENHGTDSERKSHGGGAPQRTSSVR